MYNMYIYFCFCYSFGSEDQLQDLAHTKSILYCLAIPSAEDVASLICQYPESHTQISTYMHIFFSQSSYYGYVINLKSLDICFLYFCSSFKFISVAVDVVQLVECWSSMCEALG